MTNVYIVKDATFLAPVERPYYPPDGSHPKSPVCKRCPVRFTVFCLTCTAACMWNMLRYNLSVAIVAMVNFNGTKQGGSTAEDDTCPVPYSVTNTSTTLYEEREFDWSPTLQGVLLGAYFYGFICTQLLGGRLSEILGPKWILGSSILLQSIMTILTPAAARYSIVLATAGRVVMGMAGGVYLSSQQVMASYWAPVKERSLTLAVNTVGGNVGIIAGLTLTGIISKDEMMGGWPTVFYLFGALGCVWFLLWAFIVYEKPQDHPRISQTELDWIMQGRDDTTKRKKNTSVPWRSILLSLPVWALTISKFFTGWGFHTIGTKLPAFLESVQHFTMEQNGYVNSLVYVARLASPVLAGSLSDFIRSREYLSITVNRKIFGAIGMLVPGICLLTVPWAGCNSTLVVILLLLSMGFIGFLSAATIPISMDMAPELAGTIFGYTNTISGTTGFLAPLVAGLLLDKNSNSKKQWSYVFYMAGGFSCLAAAIFVLFASAEKQEWSSTAPKKTKSSVTTASGIDNPALDAK